MNKIALVTGTNKGIGLQVVKDLLKAGVTTIMTSRNEERGRHAFEQIKDNGALSYHRLDITDIESMKKAVEYVKSEYGRLDILINNAAFNYDKDNLAGSVEMSEVHTTLETNLYGGWQLIQLTLPMMRQHHYGRIVNVSSGAGSFSDMVEMGAVAPAYSISKAALNVVTVKLAAELAETDILVNSVCPGWVKTDMGGSEAPRSVEQGAETIVWAALLPSGGPSGKFFRDKVQIQF